MLVCVCFAAGEPGQGELGRLNLHKTDRTDQRYLVEGLHEVPYVYGADL